MLPLDTIQAIGAILTSDRITYKGSEVRALNKMLADLENEQNQQTIAARVKPALQVVPKPEPGPRAAVAEDFTATG